MRFVARLLRRLLMVGVLIGIGTALMRFFKDPEHREQAASAASNAASKAGEAVRAVRGGGDADADASEPPAEEKPADS